MDKITRIRAEIERRMKIYKGSNYGISLRYQELEELFSFLDSLSEEPDKSLEEAAEEKYPVYWKSYPKDGIVRSESSYDTNKQCREAFIAGAEWQASQMPMPEDTVLFQKGVAEGRRLEREDSIECEVIDVGLNYLDLALIDAESLGLKDGDRVKVIALKTTKMKANSLEELVTNSNIAGELRNYTDWHTRLVKFAQLVADWQHQKDREEFAKVKSTVTRFA